MFFLRAQIGGDFSAGFVFGPFYGRGAPENVFLVKARAAFNEELDDFEMAVARGLVQWRAVGVAAEGVEEIWIGAGVEEQARDLSVAKIGGLAERDLAFAGAGGGKQAASGIEIAEGCGDGERDAAAATDQRGEGLEGAVQGSRFHGSAGIDATIAEQIDERDLPAALLGHAAGGDECQRDFTLGRGGAGVENDLCDFDDVGRHGSAADGIFGDELNERRIVEVVPALKRDVLVYEFGMQLEPGAETLRVAGVDQIDGVTEDGVLDAFVMRQVEAVGERGLLNVTLEARPAGIAALAGDGELRVAEREFRVVNFRVARVAEAGMELADALSRVRGARGMGAQQGFGLMLEVVEVGIGRESSYRHGNFLSYARCPQVWAESQFEEERIVCSRWT